MCGTCARPPDTLEPRGFFMRIRHFCRIAAPSFIALACAGGTVKEKPDGTSGTGPDTDVVTDSGTPVRLSLSASATEQKVTLDAALDAVEEVTAADFAERTAVTFGSLSYAPGEAEGLDLIENSNLGLTQAELAQLGEKGFVITDRNSFPSFTYGYASIYGDDLPLYVSADSILHALHRSYDNILKTIERDSIVPELEALLSGMSASLAASSHTGALRKDLDVYLAVAQSLLTDNLVSPLDSSNAGIVSTLFAGCKAADGVELVEIFGAKRTVDFSQCEPRGHYTDYPELQRYFRAMMWLGRIDLRLIETQSDGSSLFRRRQLEAAWALVELMGQTERAAHKGIDDFITAFVGEHDYMTPAQFALLAEDLGVSSLAEVADFSDQQLAQAIIDGGYGTQRISSHYMVNGGNVATLPLSSSFAFFGQRYVIDSHVFSNVVYDRVARGERRWMPNPLDVAYAALGNDQAGMLLSEEMQRYEYAPELAAMRTIVDSEPPSFWQMNLYNRWLGALRELSPSEARAAGPNEALPEVAKTQAWGERLLNTQLASWAELRHDTILYVKQSYTSGVTCEFPDAYVEPYPAFFGALEDYAAHALGVLGQLSFPAPAGATAHFENFARVAGILREMAEHQRTGTPHTEEHMTFINDLVTLETHGCGGPDAAIGWYPELIYGEPLEFDPTIADVHTQPEDDTGEVGRILHVGTGRARLMVTTVETCSGPRAYAGLVSSYYERIEEDWNRLTDPNWVDIIYSEDPQSPPWIQQHIVP